MNYQGNDMDELLAIYALDALDGEEKRMVEAALADSAELQAQLDELRETLAVVVDGTEDTLSTPSLDVWDSIRSEISGDVAETPRLATATDIDSSRRWSKVATWVAVAAVLASLALGARVVDLQNRVNQEPSVEEIAQGLVTDPGSDVVTLAGAEGFEDASARIVLGADGVGYILSENLAPLADDRTYQLWAIVATEGDPRVISAAVLGSDPIGVSPFQAVGEVVGLAITEEPTGGVPVSEGATIAVWLAE